MSDISVIFLSSHELAVREIASVAELTTSGAASQTKPGRLQMGEYFQALRHNSVNLLRFSGRDTVAQFWAWAGTLLAVTFVAGGYFALRLMRRLLEQAQHIAATHPEDVTVTQGPGRISVQITGNHPELMPDFASLVPMMIAVTGVFVVLVAAAVARRLHDRDKSGFWGLLPLPFLVAGFVLMPLVSESFLANTPNFGLFFLLFFNNVLYLALLLYLAIILAMPGTSGANRFGEATAN
jgi:uncharacterized membrane protein YhaH (DUF805 family)